MSSKHDVSYVKRNTRLSVFFLLSIAMFATGMVVSMPDAEARAGGGGGGAARGGGGGGGAARGGGGGGRKAQSSVSGANHAGRPNAGGGNAGNRPNNGGNTGNRPNNGGNAGNRPNNGGNGGNRGNGNNNYSGNKINTGNVNIGNDVNIDIDGGYGRGGYYHNPIATGIAIGAVAATTAAVLGSSYYALPPSGCSNVFRNGISYYYCGSVYYQQSWSGNDVVYVVVNP